MSLLVSMSLSICVFVLIVTLSLGFSPNSRRVSTRPDIVMQMDGESTERGYGPVGSLIRQGPVPFFIRLAKPDTYEAAVDKYMRGEKCSRIEAMANMDAYFQDPNGWAGQKLREKNGKASKVDYVNANVSPFNLILTAVWATGITGLFWRIFQVQVLEK